MDFCFSLLFSLVVDSYFYLSFQAFSPLSAMILMCIYLHFYPAFILWIFTYLAFSFQGMFHHWRTLFLHFDTYFKMYLCSRKDLGLSDNILGDDSPFPKQAVLQILRVMQIILQNCHNKGSFCSFEILRSSFQLKRLLLY